MINSSYLGLKFGMFSLTTHPVNVGFISNNRGKYPHKNEANANIGRYEYDAARGIGKK